ncbi:MAG: Eco57I restriction-modification methylase domain-containing protein, partial [Leptospiraceae bacterium]|nr:Eco57I restriction-modification methylase domain-containing protein [Leptospiraceae bacterium]
MVHILQKLDPENKYWKEVQKESIIGAEIRKLEQDKKAIEGLSDAQVREKALQAVQERLKELEEIFDKSYNFDDYSRKLYLIENCIYGIDIQPIAVQIAKLRFFISLIIDQHVRPSSMMDENNKNNLGIRPLPNLETKFVAANTLIGLDKPQQLTLRNPKVEEKENQLKELRHQYFTASTRKEKLVLQKKDKQLRKEIADLLKADGWSSKVAEQIVSYDPYDQNQSCGWFDPEWMFGIIVPPTSLSEKKVPPTSLPELNSGFDIIIGNPPYIQLQKEGGKLAKAYEKQGYKTFERTGDIYSLFYEKGMQLLKSQGILTYITSNKWMRAGYGKSTRQFFLQYNPKKLIDLGSGIFESATVDTNILLIQKAPNQNQLQAVDLSKSKNIEQLNHLQYLTLKNLTAESWTISSDIEQRIKAKIEAKGKPLKEWDIQIYRGILTGYNEAFIIDGSKRAELIAQDPRSAEIIKPLLRGRDIKRYQAEWQDLWLIFVPWHFPLHNDSSIKGASEKAEEEFKKQYPAIYGHLLSHKEKLLSRNKAETGIRYEWYALQRWAADYYQEFEKEKIIYPNMTLFLPFVYDEKGFYTNQKCFIITSNIVSLKYLTGFFNSKVSHRWIRENCPELQGGTRELSKIFFQNIPIPDITTKQQQPIVNLVTQILALKSESKDTSELEKQIDQ